MKIMFLIFLKSDDDTLIVHALDPSDLFFHFPQLFPGVVGSRGGAVGGVCTLLLIYDWRKDNLLLVCFQFTHMQEKINTSRGYD